MYTYYDIGNHHPPGTFLRVPGPSPEPTANGSNLGDAQGIQGWTSVRPTVRPFESPRTTSLHSECSSRIIRMSMSSHISR